MHEKALLSDTPNNGYELKNLGRSNLALGVYSEAHHRLEEALSVFRVRGDMNGVGQTLGCLGYLALRRSDYQSAYDHITQNLQIVADTHMNLPSLTALCGAALLRVGKGQVEDAMELYELALQHKHVANSQWYDDVVGQYIRAAAEALPLEVIEKARTHGRRRELRSTLEELLTKI